MATEEDWKKYAEDVIPKLKERGFLEEKEVNSKLGIFLVILGVVFIIGSVSFFGWQVYENKLGTNVDLNSTCSNFCPEIPPCPPIPSCPSCPSNPACPNFPSSLNVIIKNSS